jgi:hypothetical protein
MTATAASGSEVSSMLRDILTLSGQSSHANAYVMDGGCSMEEVEQIDELSPNLLDRAAKQASKNAELARDKGHDEAGAEHMGQAVRLRTGYHDAVERDRKKASMASMSPAKQRKYAISQKNAMGEEADMEEDGGFGAATSGPNEFEASVEQQLEQGDDLHKPHEQYAGMAKLGDNPMASEDVDQLAESLWKEFKASK